MFFFFVRKDIKLFFGKYFYISFCFYYNFIPFLGFTMHLINKFIA